MLLRSLLECRFALVRDEQVGELCRTMDERGWVYRITQRGNGLSEIHLLAH